jgi:hypothetical protein
MTVTDSVDAEKTGPEPIGYRSINSKPAGAKIIGAAQHD